MTDQASYFYVAGWDELKPEQRDKLTQMVSERTLGQVVAGRDSKTIVDDHGAADSMAEAWEAWEKIGDIQDEHERQVNRKTDGPLEFESKQRVLDVLAERLAQQFALLGLGHDGKPAPAQTTATPAPDQNDAQAATTPESAPEGTGGDGHAPLTTSQEWSLNRPTRFQGYGKPLYDYLKAANIDKQPKPKARDLLDAWKTNLPPDVTEVTDNGLKYYDAKGNTKPADLEAIRKAIGRMTK